MWEGWRSVGRSVVCGREWSSVMGGVEECGGRDGGEFEKGGVGGR